VDWNIFQKIFGKTERKPCFCVVDGKLEQAENPLPEWFPGLYREKPEDRFAQRGKMLDECQGLLRDFMSACRVYDAKLQSIIVANIDNLLDIPAVYETQKFLKAKKLDRYYSNNFLLAGMVQLACLRGKSEMRERVRQNMMPMLLGIFFRYHGFGFLRPAEQEALQRTSKFDIADKKQRLMRDAHLEECRKVAATLARHSEEKFLHLVGDNAKRPGDLLPMIRDVITFTTRLMGRTAEPLSVSEIEAIHPLAGYAAVLHNFCAAWYVTNKRVGLILAEEWSRARTSHKHSEIAETARYNLHAVQDVFRICRCTIIPDFQGSGRDAVYSETDKLLFRKQVLPSRKEEGDEAGDDAPRFSGRWQICRLKEKPVSRNVSIRDAIAGKKRLSGEDPTDNNMEMLD
jgi:hypothetical protein